MAVLYLIWVCLLKRGFLMAKLHYISILFISVALIFISCLKTDNSVLNNGGVPVEQGVVYSVTNNSPLDSVKVAVSGIKKNSQLFGGDPVFTDSGGHFTIGIGGVEENVYQDTAYLTKPGYFDTSFVVYPISNRTYSLWDTIRMRPIGFAKSKIDEN